MPCVRRRRPASRAAQPQLRPKPSSWASCCSRNRAIAATELTRSSASASTGIRMSNSRSSAASSVTNESEARTAASNRAAHAAGSAAGSCATSGDRAEPIELERIDRYPDVELALERGEQRDERERVEDAGLEQVVERFGLVDVQLLDDERRDAAFERGVRRAEGHASRSSPGSRS